jgi:putative Mg2+ transporter-C (MgtC) family protein
MMNMPLYPTWQDIGLRLVLTFIAGAIIGFDRETSGHPAGLRTTILVGLAASVAMIQANILLPIGGKTASSFGVMDLMRLPLGILTGVGFIGGGTILKRGDLVTGVTTAATLWIVTVIGLCFGGGQLDLGVAGTVLAAITLWTIRWLDVRLPREQHATVEVLAAAGPSSVSDFTELIAPLGFQAHFYRQGAGGDDSRHAKLCFGISWKRPESAGVPLDLLELVNRHYSVLGFELTSETRHRD